jgi:hypothetical protein
MSLLKALDLPLPKRKAASGAAPNPAAQGATRPAAAASSAGPQGHAGAAQAARPAPPAKKLDVNNYIALINGIDHQVMNWKQPGPIDVSPSDAHDLVSAHRDLLVNLHTALVMIKTTPVQALALWEKISPAVHGEVEKSLAAGLAASELAGVRQQMTYLNDTLFAPAAYAAAKRDAEAQGGLEAPDTALLADRFKKAEGELEEANKLFEESLKIAAGTAKLAGLGAPKEVKEIIEMVMLPGSIDEKLAYARKHGMAGTAAELLAKVTGATGTIIKNVGEVGEKVLDARKAIVLSRGASKATKEAAERLEKVAGKFKKLAAAGKAIGTAASYAAVIADGVKLVSALSRGDYDEALKAGSDMAIDAAPLLLGEDVAGPLAVVVVVVKSELEVWKLAAEFIRWCKDETVRQAAESFVKQCDVIAKGAAIGLVADCTLLLNASSASVQAIALKKANQEAANVSKGIRALATHVTSKGKDAIGGYPDVVASLGRPAIAAMGVVFDENDGVLLVANQIADVFHGANEMAKYVKAHYTN